MFYLCPRHRSELVRQPAEKLQDLWLSCLNQGSLFYELQLMRDALPFIGCAFELSEIRLQQQEQPARSDIAQLTLSALYLINACGHMRDHQRAHSAQLRCESMLAALTERPGQPDWARHCRGILLEPRQHRAFFREYLNYPFEPGPASQMVH